MENSKQKIIFLRGMSGSGKSTAALKMLKENSNLRRVNKDDLRIELFNGKYNRKKEGIVVQTERELVREYLSKGYDVVIDNTHLNLTHYRAYRKIAKEFNVEFVLNDSFLEVPFRVCVDRDSKRKNPVGEKVIRKQFNQYVLPEKQAALYSPDLEPLFIFDYDGTITQGPRNRSPYEWHKVGNDLPNNGTIHILEAVKSWGYAKVFLVSGRDESCRNESVKWLRDNLIDEEFIDEFYMRPAGDKRKDTIVKREIYENYIKDKYDVIGVFDDRPSVCSMWREELFLPVYQIGDPYNNF